MQAEDAAALREGVRGAGARAGARACCARVIVRAVGARAAGELRRSDRRRARSGATARRCRSAAIAVHTPGHTAGHLALLLPRDGGVLFTGDAATNFARLGVGPIYEDVDEGMRSLRRLAELEFETALFAHGRPLAPRAAERFRARFARG